MKNEKIENSIDRKAYDRSQLLYNPELLENLAKFNISLSTKTPTEIESLIKGKPRFELIPFQAHYSSKENPCVTLEHGASFCSLFIAADKAGNEVSVHQPLLYEDKERVKKNLEVSGFIDELNRLDQEKIFFLTGTNISNIDKEREVLLQQLKDIFGQEINFLFLKSEGVYNEKISLGHKAFQQIKLSAKNLFKIMRGLTTQKNLINNIFIIPAAVSQTNKTELILPHSNNEDYIGQYSVLKATVDRLKAKLNFQETNRYNRSKTD